MRSTMDVLNDVLSNLRKKYNKMNQLMDLTKELEKAANFNDADSFGMILDMRQKAMNFMDKLDAENIKQIQTLPTDLQMKMLQVLQPSGEPVRLSNPLETDIYDTNRQIVTLAQKIAVLDSNIARKIGADRPRR